MTERIYKENPFTPVSSIEGPAGEIFEYTGNYGFCKKKQSYYADYLQTY